MSPNSGLTHPLSRVRRWRAATQSNGKRKATVSVRGI
jgi:hypothetical protein